MQFFACSKNMQFDIFSETIWIDEAVLKQMRTHPEEVTAHEFHPYPLQHGVFISLFIIK